MMSHLEIRNATRSACGCSATLARAQAFLAGNIPKPTMSTINNKLSELRITEAYLMLSCISENACGARMVSLKRIGSHEIRMFEAAPADSADRPLFWMELFDHDEQSAVDSCGCYAIEQAAATFEEFALQAIHADELSPDGPDDPPR
jgi:hypothetical protein